MEEFRIPKLKVTGSTPVGRISLSQLFVASWWTIDVMRPDWMNIFRVREEQALRFLYSADVNYAIQHLIIFLVFDWSDII
jgi:hypothetical protein